MVGITGYIGDKNAMPIILQLLQAMQSFEHESIGVATISLSDSMQLRRAVIVKDAVFSPREAGLEALEGNIGIGISRRTTQAQLRAGRSWLEGMQPHTDCRRRIAVVLNGVVANYRELRLRLKEQGHVFSGGSDSELMVHLIEEKMKLEGFKGSCLEAASEAEGGFSFLAVSEAARRAVAFRRDMPLYVASLDRGFIFASGEEAFCNWGRNVVCIQNNSMAVACKKEVVMHNI